jgi:phospholipase/carboxylesterase
VVRSSKRSGTAPPASGRSRTRTSTSTIYRSSLNAIEPLHIVQRPASGDPEGALALLHGRGVDEHDLAPLFDELDPERRLLGVAPRGPLALPGSPGAHWYIVRRVGYPDPDSFAEAYRRLGEWLARLSESSGIPPGRTALGGFSQGAVMAYALALGEGRPPPAAILAMSGFVPVVPGWTPDLRARRGLPVAIVHGTLDPVIGIEFAREARELLERAGLDVSYRESPIGHGVDPASLPELAGWLRGVFELPD